jgi:7,8-dihydropterin-6-yl-methyl-4-(beta-D-ribofuranosyl)aminobenzene 5'-phosphate synthase
MPSSDFRGQYTWYVSDVIFGVEILSISLHLRLQIVGGLHLASPELADRIKPTVKFLSDDLIPAPTYVLPMHCSGFAVKIALEAALGEGCVPAGTGHTVTINGVPDDNAILQPPSIRSHKITRHMF